MPKFVKKPEPVEVMEYSEAKFETTVTGLPEPNVEWFVSYFPGCFTQMCMCTGVYTRTTYIMLFTASFLMKQYKCANSVLMIPDSIVN